ncbi:imidazole glycerol phosphate synthase subunit HisH [Pseudoalteromonas aurantia]|uniref:Imidazole glycerol phosphate synthase subunit HisH n=1 Tax=Pseudoalteromonas aurantia 208 TaxID=1314867 RepID=A0ABR9EE40_9GAMM|nr:imidazole glycerol phosphate synthase subunit HisH [Pseudoalteromonas aurantia]MBE0369255.1 glutamine amidotransferase [Pseudoalteromonas aurantia 208]
MAWFRKEVLSLIRVVDYGVGNIQAFLTLFKRLGLEAKRAVSPLELSDATHLILPGVGHFDHAMQSLNESGMRAELDRLVCNEKIPVMGICVGMQMLADSSEEGELKGLGWIPGKVKSFANNPVTAKLPMPHMGWNNLTVSPNTSLFSKESDLEPQFYFLHSYYFDASDKQDVVAAANYGMDFDAIVSRGHIYGVQCHPEKSHHWGAQLIKNFVEYN